MMPHHILEKVLELKVFQMWELVDELSKDWDFILTRKRIKDRVRTWIKNNIETGFVKVVSREPLIFAVKEYAKEWREHVRLRTCPVCGKEFLPLKSQTLYCSSKCRQRAEYERRRESKKEYLRQRKDLTRKASKKYKQKLQSLTPAKKKGVWTQEELELLRSEYKKKGQLTRQDLVSIAQTLGRSFSAVMHKYYEEVRR